MKINHAWKAARPQRPAPLPKSVPMDQVAAMLKITQENAYGYAMQLCTDMAVIALSEAFGFGQERVGRFLDALDRNICGFIKGVEWEFDSETVGLRFREREQARPDLAYTLAGMDAKLRPLFPPGVFKEYPDRYGKFGGRGSFCKTEEGGGGDA